jgi:hypothetical protein
LKHTTIILCAVDSGKWRNKMSEQQSDDFFIPAFLLNLPPKAETNGRNTEEAEDFLRDVEDRTESYPPDDGAE